MAFDTGNYVQYIKYVYIVYQTRRIGCVLV